MKPLLLDIEVLIWWDGRRQAAREACADSHSGGDPFDRLIVAAAQVEGLRVVSSDSQFRMYDVSLLDARE